MDGNNEYKSNCSVVSTSIHDNKYLVKRLSSLITYLTKNKRDLIPQLLVPSYKFLCKLIHNNIVMPLHIYYHPTFFHKYASLNDPTLFNHLSLSSTKKSKDLQITHHLFDCYIAGIIYKNWNDYDSIRFDIHNHQVTYKHNSHSLWPHSKHNDPNLSSGNVLHYLVMYIKVIKYTLQLHIFKDYKHLQHLKMKQYMLSQHRSNIRRGQYSWSKVMREK